MTKYSILLFGGLLGGLVTFLGGLVGNIPISALIMRSLIAVILFAIICLIAFAFISKSLFPGYAISIERPKRAKPQKTQPNEGPEENKSPVKESEEDVLIAAAQKHTDLDSSQDLTKILEQKINAETNSIEGQLRNADSKELANIVKYSINKDE